MEESYMKDNKFTIDSLKASTKDRPDMNVTEGLHKAVRKISSEILGNYSKDGIREARDRGVAFGEAAFNRMMELDRMTGGPLQKLSAEYQVSGMDMANRESLLIAGAYMANGDEGLAKLKKESYEAGRKAADKYCDFLKKNNLSYGDGSELIEDDNSEYYDINMLLKNSASVKVTVDKDGKQRKVSVESMYSLKDLLRSGKLIKRSIEIVEDPEEGLVEKVMDDVVEVPTEEIMADQAASTEAGVEAAKDAVETTVETVEETTGDVPTADTVAEVAKDVASTVKDAVDAETTGEESMKKENSQIKVDVTPEEVDDLISIL